MTTALSGGQCFWHGDEPAREGDYRICHECGHIWRTETEFRTDEAHAFNEFMRTHGDDITRMTPTDVDPAKVYSCPLCAHDF